MIMSRILLVSGILCVLLSTVVGRVNAQSSDDPAVPPSGSQSIESSGAFALSDKLRAAVRETDWESALRLGTQLAEQGDPEAQGILGIIYYDGLAGEKDLKASEYWLKKSVDQGFSSADALLGQVYFDMQRFAEAKIYLQRGAEAGNPLSMLLLSSMYGRGRGLEVDRSKAMRWLVKAGPRHPHARRTIESLFPISRTGETISEDAKAKFFAFFKEAAEYADTEDVMAMGEMYQYGRGASKDADAALQWYGIAVRQGDAEGQYRYAKITKEILDSNLDGLIRNAAGGDRKRLSAVMSQLALDHYYMAAQQKHARAMEEIGNLYRDGGGVSKDTLRAYLWWSLSKLTSNDPVSNGGTITDVLEWKGLAIQDMDTGKLAGLRQQALAHYRNGTIPDAPAVDAPPAVKLLVAGGVVNVRGEPGTHGRVVTRVKRGQEVFAMDRRGDWVQVGVPGEPPVSGWIYASLLRNMPRVIPSVQRSVAVGNAGPKLIVKARSVNVRAKPALDGAVMAGAVRGQEVLELERRGDWIRVRIPNERASEGWIYGSLLRPAS